MLREFRGVWHRVDRARLHAEALSEAWGRFLERDPFDPVLDIEDDGTGRILLEPQGDAFPGKDLALELGELLYQLRAALDAAIYAAAIVVTGKNPPPNDEELGFPVCRSRRGFEQAGRKIAPLSDKTRAVIESVQPYNAPSGLAPELAVMDPRRILSILNDWSRKDRHRALHFFACWSQGGSPQFWIEPPASLGYCFAADGLLDLENGCELAAFKIDGFSRGLKVQANPRLAIEVGVDEPPESEAPNDNLGMRILAMIAFVQETVLAIERTLES